MGNANRESPGEALARLRIAHGLSLRMLAESAGVARSTVYGAEAGRPVKLAVLDRLADVLGADVYAIVAVWPPPSKAPTRLADARRESGLTLNAAAARAGVAFDVFKRAEGGRRVHPGNAKKIADAFGLDVADVLPFERDQAA